MSDKKYVIITKEEVANIDFSQVIETSVNTLSGPDKTKPIIHVANAFQALADSMDNVSESARNLQAPGVMQGIELYQSGAQMGLGQPVVITQVQNTNNVNAPATTVVGIEAEGRTIATNAANPE